MDQTRNVADHITEFVPEAQVSIGRSHGIQAADCLAGAVAEDHNGDSDWLSQFDDKKPSAADTKRA